MNIQELEIPYKNERSRRYRVFEILPGFISWSILLAPALFSLINAGLTALFIIAFFLVWFVRAIGLNIRVLQGWSTLQQHQKYDWLSMIEEVQELSTKSVQYPKWHYDNIERLKKNPAPLKPNDIVHAIIIPTHNEGRAILEPTVQYILNSTYDISKTIFVLAYEERGGPEVEEQAEQLIKDYKDKFRHAFAIKHPKDLPGEIKGKGPNATFAGRALQKYLEKEGIDPNCVMVTTLDADNRPHPNYFAALTYTVAVSPDPLHVSYQPIPMFTNNIWDAPAPMRVIATGNSFWMVVQALRPHMLRNFSSHAQSMQALIDTDFWSVRTIVEDGHQFWRSYFRYDGNYEVYPIFVPIYQDAVLAETYRKTIREQFIQLRRWAWGASDIAYVAEKGFFSKNKKLSTFDVTAKFLRLLEGHVSWATAPLILLFAAFIPAYFNPTDYTANQLPLIASRIQSIAMVGIVITLFLSFKALPPKPKRYKAHRSLWMVLQWVMLPVTGICFNSAAALTSQTRLIFKRYLDTFDATKKAVKTSDNKTII
ncbi:MAG TPA: glycosyltransferase family 2 protein [Candidatus Saccharibacteria bacterium]|nr:glycosyltransferase family 2 protein [Candidatus Saccharibacteria bacterium]